ncbi:MAG: T9SS type A sorting domain-containing protein [Chitinophagaceae bacterium]|nr:T9SS type A sorting domain-containing protein [Chitinophagaceae bacterium]
MKKRLLTCIALLPFILKAQQTYTWTVTSGSWAVSSNWSPQRITPAPNDILEFNIAATVTDVPVSETVGKIRVHNNASVTFSAATSSTINIGNASVPAPHFVVEPGSALDITGSNAILLDIGSGFTAQIQGNLSFSGSSHRLTAASPNSIVFSTGSVFTANSGFAGNPFGNTAANRNTVIFQTGATYIFKDGGNPFGLTAPDAITIFNSGSIYRHQVNGVGPSMSGRTYGHLYIEANVNFGGIGSARDCIIQNDLNILSGFFSFKPNSLGTHTGNFNIYGNILASGTSYIDIGSDYMTGAVQLPGTVQHIGGGGGTGTISFQHLVLNNTRTSLSRPLSVSGVLSLQNGRMITTASSLLMLTATASLQSCAHDYSNLSYNDIGCDLSYIEGPVQKSGLSGGDFAFPVGINDKLRPLLLRNATGTFTVSYVRGDPYLEISGVMGTGIHHASRLEYWNVAGSGSAQVELTYFDPNSGGITDMNALRVVHFDGSAWANQGVSSFSGMPGSNGSITSTSVTGFGSFTLAGSTDYPNNPLPQKILYWEASLSRNAVTLKWQIADIDQYKGYYIEKSADGKSFSDILEFIPSKTENESTYYAYDKNLITGNNIYRIKLIGTDGRVFYSGIRAVRYQHPDVLRVYPIPAREKIFIKIPDSRSISELAIVNISGSVVKRVNTKHQTTVEIDILNLLPGTYFIKTMQLPSPVIVKFIKFNQ